MAEILSGQERIFQSRRVSLEGRVDITRQRIAQYQAQIKAFEAQFSAGRRQLDLIREELKDVEELTDKGLERKPRLLALKRQAAALDGEQGEFQNNMAQAREAIAEAEMEILRIRSGPAERGRDRTARGSDAIGRGHGETGGGADTPGPPRCAGAGSGDRADLRYFAPGAVVLAGRADPRSGARDDRWWSKRGSSPTISTSSMSDCRPRSSSAPSRAGTTPQIDGKVTRVTADALTDERTGVIYYVARSPSIRRSSPSWHHVQLQPACRRRR